MRKMRKPKSNTFRVWTARFNQLNNYLALFPKDEIGQTDDPDHPENWDFGPYNDQLFDEDEIKDILERGIPNKWAKIQMEQGFDVVKHSIQEYVEFCERLEFAEDVTETVNSGNGKPKQASQNKSDGTKSKNGQNDEKHGSKQDANSAKSSKRGNKRKERQKKWCPLHETDSHDMNDCKVILSQVKKMRAAWDSQDSSQKRSKKGRSGAEGGDLHAMVKNMVEKELKQAVSSLGKRKKDSSEILALEESANMFASLDINDDTLKKLKEDDSDSDDE
jgi:hypothetical protein